MVRRGWQCARGPHPPYPHPQQLAARKGRQASSDHLYAAASEAEWAKRQAGWDADAAARRALSEEVARGRLEQMAEHARARAAEGSWEGGQVATLRAAQAEADARDRAAAEARRDAARAAAAAVREQMEGNAARRAAAEQEEYLSHRLTQKARADYDARVQTLLREPAAGAPTAGRTAYRY